MKFIVYMPEASPETKRVVFDRIKALQDTESQLTHDGRLRYVVKGSTAIVLYSMAETMADVTVADQTQWEQSMPRINTYEEIPIRAFAQNHRTTVNLSIKLPYSRGIPHDIDLYLTDPILVDKTNGFNDDWTKRLNQAIKETQPVNLERELVDQEDVTNLLQDVVQLNVIQNGKMISVLVESPEACLRNKVHQLLTGAHGLEGFFEPKRFAETEAIVNWAIDVFGYEWVREEFAEGFDHVVNPLTPMDNDSFLKSTVYKIIYTEYFSLLPNFEESWKLIDNAYKKTKRDSQLRDHFLHHIYAISKYTDPNEFPVNNSWFPRILSSQYIIQKDHFCAEAAMMITDINDITDEEKDAAFELFFRLYEHSFTAFIGVPEWIADPNMRQVVGEILDKVDQGEINDIYEVMGYINPQTSVHGKHIFRRDRTDSHLSEEIRRAEYFRGLAEIIRENLFNKRFRDICGDYQRSFYFSSSEGDR